MLRSLYSGVSGLNNHQTRMDVIGNNISNVNTYGFKKGRVTFQDLLYQTSSAAARPTEQRGGINPKQVGLGMTVASIDRIHTNGSLRTTGLTSDVALTGDGFFVLERNGKTSYTRKGAFSLDANGHLVNPADGKYVQGYGIAEFEDGSILIERSAGLQKMLIPVGQKLEAKATTDVRYQCNLDSKTPAILPNTSTEQIQKGQHVTTISVYDSQGSEQKLSLNFRRDTDINGNPINNQWRVTINVQDISEDGARAIENVIAQVDENSPDVDNEFILNFDNTGKPLSIQDDVGTGIPIIGENSALTVNLNYDLPGRQSQNIRLNLGNVGDVNGVTQYQSKTTTKAVEQNGKALSYLDGYKINDDGIIVGSFSNGEKKQLGQLAVATFANNAGLEKIGESSYEESTNSGTVNITYAGIQGAGYIKSGVLEMSNVQLSEEFTDMIVTQRGFQANSRVITTSDVLLEEVLRLKN